MSEPTVFNFAERLTVEETLRIDRKMHDHDHYHSFDDYQEDEDGWDDVEEDKPALTLEQLQAKNPSRN